MAELEVVKRFAASRGLFTVTIQAGIWILEDLVAYYNPARRNVRLLGVGSVSGLPYIRVFDGSYVIDLDSFELWVLLAKFEAEDQNAEIR